MNWRVHGFGAVAVLLLFLAGTVLVLQVRVHRSGIGAACGAPFDVISGRADWQAWYALDLTDPRLGVGTPLVRTEACPVAVNRRTAWAGALGAMGVIAATAEAIVTKPHRRARTRRVPLRRLGSWITIIGIALTGCGLIGLVVLLANPRAVLFVYVDRWIVGTIGGIVLIPAIALAAGGRALMLVGETSDEQRQTTHENP